MKEKGANIAVWETLVTDDYLYVKANITEYTKDAGGITEERIYAFDFKKKAEIMLTEVPEEEQTISLISANDGVIYYSCQDENMRELNIDNITIEQYKEAERTMHTGIYRVDMEDAKPELVKTVDNGMVLTANDDYGVIYAQYMGNGFFEGKNLVQYDYSNRTEKEIFAMEGEKGFSFQMKNAEYVWIRSGNEDYNIYKLTIMKKVDIPWEYPAQASSAHPVPGGFAVPKEELKEGQVKKTGGEEWRFIAVQ